MKVWIVIVRAGDDAQADGVEDDLFVRVYKNLVHAKRECVDFVRERLEDEPEMGDASSEIEWGETTANNSKHRRIIGRPKASIEESFELLQSEVV